MNTALTSNRHYVDPTPFDPGKTEPVGTGDESFYRASSWQLMWWKFRRHRVAVVSAFVLLAFYASCLISEFIAPYHLHTRNAKQIYAPPQQLHFFHEGSFVGPFVYGNNMQLDMETLRRVYTPDPAQVHSVRFF